MTAIFYAACGGFVWCSFLWAVGIVGCSAARKRYRLRPRSPLATAPASSVPGVSILRPLKGLDTNLYENLESTFTQEYPNFEILLSVADENDQALPVARELIAKYPHVNCRIIVGEEIVGVNPKVNNLVRSYREAAHDILWVIDSNVTVHSGTLARSVDALSGSPNAKKRIALVHHVPFAVVTENKIGSRIEEAFLNTNHAKMYIAINTVAVDSCVMGKSNVYRRSDLERVNGSLKPVPTSGSQPGTRGLPAFARFLAEDNMIAGALWHELGDRHDLSCDIARNVVGNMSLSDYIRRRARWIRVRKHMVLSATLLEPFTESVVLSLILAWSLNTLFAVPPLLSLAAHFAIWIYVDLDVYASLAGHPLPAGQRWSFMAAWAARELLALPIFLFAIFGSQVTWRGRNYTILRNGEVERAEQTRSWFQRLRQPKNYDPLSTEL
ncbi:Glycosyltransferase family 21 protein [Mycena indigotica]|uniref:Ceramide glucosyltransferase n=1 Tax=Mycena indigotica TaxID=2126181 RepID=A0A8H6SWQ7_9AGAR|nr:Glycosyltransferase family 21 protein [Mycena indigotica]KAF7306769.1 Glycosyltransferase family 21 protein [Mycena indigotica]